MKEKQLLTILKKYNQQDILDHYNKLSSEKKGEFLGNMKGLDFDLIFRLHNEFSSDKKFSGSVKDLGPAKITTIPKTREEKALHEKVRIVGEALIRNKQVAVLIVAGGQGSRLGHDGPKGMFPVSPVKNKPLFQLFVEQVKALSLRYSTEIPLLIMTSQENHQDTVHFFESHAFYGLNEDSVHFFQQDMLPSIALEGRLILKDDTQLFINPDGHGGSLKALYDSGLLKSLLDRGFQELFYCQVDNPLVKIADPVFLGYHALTGAEVSTKVVRRRSIEEKVGIYMSAGGRDAIIEYSDLSPEYMSALNKNGDILYWAGNTAVHIFSLSFVKRLNRHGFALPYHCARKTVEYQGRGVSAKKRGVWKFETFVFDAIPLAQKTCCMEVIREEEFSPVKNKEGVDSPDTARAAMSDLHRNWLGDAGIVVPEGIRIEISPLFALDKEEFLMKLKDKCIEIRGDCYFGEVM